MTNSPRPPFSLHELVQRLRKSDSIPALDENVAQLCRMTGNHDTAATDLTLIIMRDAALTSRLLALANSVVYRPRTPVKTVSAAVILLGFERVQQLSLGLTLFHKHAGNVRDKELYRLLVCAYCSGNLAMHVARAIGDEIPEELFVAGLMRQLPRLVLANGFPDLYQAMDRLVLSGKCGVDAACQQVFGVRFEEIAQAIAAHWNLGDSPAKPISPKRQDQRRKAVQLAVDASDLIFGNRSAGPEATAAVAEGIALLLNAKNLQLPEFVGESASDDPNMHHFFNLNKQDLVMMTRIAEWGKVSSSEVANSLTANYKKRPEPLPASEPLPMAQFLSELMVSVRKRYGFNAILMMAQEGIYRCIRPDCVIASFIDPQRKYLQGRLYAGRCPEMQAGRCRITLDARNRLAARNVEAGHAAVAQVGDQAILDDDSFLVEQGIASVLLMPIVAEDRPIGQFLLGRRADQPPFSPDDCLWMTAIAGHVSMSFEQLDA